MIHVINFCSSLVPGNVWFLQMFVCFRLSVHENDRILCFFFLLEQLENVKSNILSKSLNIDGWKYLILQLLSGEIGFIFYIKLLYFWPEICKLL